MAWIKAAAIDEVRKKPVVLRQGARQIAVIERNGRVYAVDNRCPHEGYPLSAGRVTDDCVLTCNWHNWKFRLDTGECLLGGDDVLSYPTKIIDGDAWVDVSDPPLDKTRGRILKGLKSAFDERDFGRICREIARLYYHGLDTKESIRAALGWTYDRLEFGTTHAIAAAADWLRLAQDFPDFEPQLICIAEAVDHFSFDALRQPTFAYPETVLQPFTDAAFTAAIESENAPQAEGLAARALSDGLHWNGVEEAFATAAFAHYNDFGHSVIYTVKAGELIRELGPAVEKFVILPLARHLVYTTREDLLPEFAAYERTLSVLPETAGINRSEPSDAPLEPPFPATTAKAFEWLRTKLTSHGVTPVYYALLEGLALNMLSFDTRYEAANDGPVSENIGWLDFTHGLTFSAAVRQLCSKYPSLWPKALAQMACFLGRNSRFLDTEAAVEAWVVTDTETFFANLTAKLLDHGYRDPIFSAHLLKTTMAVREETQAAPQPCARAMLAALNRFMHSAMKTKHVRRSARQAIELVRRDFVS